MIWRIPLQEERGGMSTKTVKGCAFEWHSALVAQTLVCGVPFRNRGFTRQP
jgi:hypothetical protein